MRALAGELASRLQRRRAANLERVRSVVDARTAGCTRLRIGDDDFLAFCSNDYLGLAQHPQVVEAFADASRRWGVGSGASHLVCGHTREHHALEEELAAFVGRGRALLFSTGYMANLAIVRTLVGRGDVVLVDRLNHASLIDAGLASGARFRRYRHADVDAMRRCLSDQDAPRTVVATDGVFSMDGDVAPLRGLSEACGDRGATLVVDDAHGFGVLGDRGRGSLELAGLGEDDVPVLMCTLGKAVGTFGAFVAGSQELVEALLQEAREYIYTTALPPAVAAATRAALRVIERESWRRATVLRHAARFREAVNGMGLRTTPSVSPIQPLLLGSEAAALEASAALRETRILVPAIRPPTVPARTSRLRITFSAAHTDADLDRLLEALHALRGRGLLA